MCHLQSRTGENNSTALSVVLLVLSNDVLWHIFGMATDAAARHDTVDMLAAMHNKQHHLLAIGTHRAQTSTQSAHYPHPNMIWNIRNIMVR